MLQFYVDNQFYLFHFADDTMPNVSVSRISYYSCPNIVSVDVGLGYTLHWDILDYRNIFNTCKYFKDFLHKKDDK